jgi:hypothetical protein
MTCVEMWIRNKMNEAVDSKGRSFVWNHMSKHNVRRKILNTRLTFGGNVELTFKTPLPGRLSRLFTVEPTSDCMRNFVFVD